LRWNHHQLQPGRRIDNQLRLYFAVPARAGRHDQAERLCLPGTNRDYIPRRHVCYDKDPARLTRGAWHASGDDTLYNLGLAGQFTKHIQLNALRAIANRRTTRASSRKTSATKACKGHAEP
jgi:hypothetical protein